MDDLCGIPSDIFFSADVLRLFDFRFLNFQNFHNFQNNCQKLFSIDTSNRNAKSSYLGHFILSARGSLFPLKLRWASDYHKQYIFYSRKFNFKKAGAKINLLKEKIII